LIGQESLKKFDDLVRTEDAKILELPSKLFDPHRFLIMKILYTQAPVGFSELKHDLNISDGNLANHLRVLENSGYVIPNKDYKDKKPWTTYALTPEGEKIFLLFKERLSKVLVNEHRK
jgi:DNA-binding HxlR family transcriptional regulator